MSKNEEYNLLSEEEQQKIQFMVRVKQEIEAKQPFKKYVNFVSGVIVTFIAGTVIIGLSVLMCFLLRFLFRMLGIIG